VTGAGGFVAGHLLDYLAGKPGLHLHGTARQPASDVGASGAVMYYGDLRDHDFVDGVVAAVRPDLVLHLAAQSSVDRAWRDPNATLANNVTCQAHLLDSIYSHCREARVLVAGSADEYGLVAPDEVPIAESQPLRPNNPYAISKIAQDMMALQYHLGRGLAIVRVRPFNHTGPRQRPDFVASAFAQQIASAEAGLHSPVIRVGNLEARRDFSDVRDVVRAHWLAVTVGTPGEVYNIASGSDVRIQDLLDQMRAMARLPVAVEHDPDRMRPSDVPTLRGDATKLRRATGWTPAIPLEQTLSDLLDYWRNELARRPS
jgi:GDP-4-dehydro-6-deoxy-D-mannose reductase